METVPRTVSIRHVYTQKKPRFQKLHAAIGSGRPSAPPLDPPLVHPWRQGQGCQGHMHQNHGQELSLMRSRSAGIDVIGHGLFMKKTPDCTLRCSTQHILRTNSRYIYLL